MVCIEFFECALHEYKIIDLLEQNSPACTVIRDKASTFEVKSYYRWNNGTSTVNEYSQWPMYIL